MNKFLLILIYGWGLLISAIIINSLAALLKLTTWHGYFLKIRESGFATASSEAGILSLIFMYLVYPLLLGLVMFGLSKWLA